MKSDVIHVTNSGDGFALALKQAEAVAAYKALPKKDALHLRLLAEEMMGMLRALTGDQEADFWIEDETDAKAFRLHLKAKADTDADLREKLLAASTTGKNAAVKGVTGKIRDLFSHILEGSSGLYTGAYSAGWCAASPESLALPETASFAGTVVPPVWSFNRVRALALSDPSKKEEWDELEKSVLARIADEIEIGITFNSVEMIVYKKF